MAIYNNDRDPNDETWEKEVINEGHYVELLDRVFIISQNLEEYVYQHPLTKKDEKLEASLEEIIDKLFDVYQYLGTKI